MDCRTPSGDPTPACEHATLRGTPSPLMHSRVATVPSQSLAPSVAVAVAAGAVAVAVSGGGAR
jgi:hypothetical protein